MAGTLTRTQMRSIIESDIIDRTDKTSLVNFALDWGLEYLDKSGTFADLHKEEITTTTTSCTCTAAADDLVTTTIDIPTGTKIVFSTTDELPDIACTFATTDVDIATNIITVSIDIASGTKIIFTGDDVPAGITAGETYYCLRQSATTIQVAATSGGAAINITDVGSGTHTITTSGGGLNADTDYWAIRQSATTIQVAQTYLKAWQETEIDIADTGTGTHTVTAYRERLAKPDSCKYIYSVRLIDGAMSRKLEPLTPRRADLFTPFGQQLDTGRPTQYCEWLDWIQLSKIPDATYVVKIRYVKWQDSFADDSATAEISHADDLIIKASAMHVWEVLGEPEQAAIMRNSLEIGLHKHKRFVERMKPDLVLKPHMGTIARADSDTQDDPWVFSQR